MMSGKIDVNLFAHKSKLGDDPDLFCIAGEVLGTKGKKNENFF